MEKQLDKKDRDKQNAQDEVSRVSKKAAKIIKRASKKKEMETKRYCGGSAIPG